MKIEDLIRDTFFLSPDTEIENSHGPGSLEGWDSLGHVNLMSAIESTYDISIDMDEIIQITSVADIKTILEKKGITTT
ncbi:acyl carrier protein [candidate division CSSED10-310 bacterium]|uniref:Acyl carrier protein n=1 Tax=candidate division CSSED10-310 bacterium TaxID=2855610 RepID=A0ABV6YVR9_UNCC1